MTLHDGRALALALAFIAAWPLQALADGGAGNSLGSLRSIGSTQDLNRPASSGRIGGIAVDPSDPSGARHFNGVPNRIAQGDTSAASDPSGNTVYIGAASGGVWKTTNGGTASNSAGMGFLRSMDGGKTWAAPAAGGGVQGSGALQNVGGSNTWSKPPTGPTALRAKTN